MYVITIIGGAKQGKTPFIKEYIKNSKCLVFDVQNEYGLKTKYEGQKPFNLGTNNNFPKSRVIDLDLDKFIELCKKKTNTVCVFEESTMFFSGKIEKPMRKLVWSKAHSGNVYLLVFHSINSLPPGLMEATDFIILFKTNDQEKTIEGKYPRLLEPFRELQKGKDGKHIKIKML